MRDALRGSWDATRRTARALGRPATLGGIGLEAAVVAAHVAVYPFGVSAERARASEDRFGVADLPPVQRGLLLGDVEAAGTPILLVHGMVDNRGVFLRLRRALRRRGFGRVYSVNYSPLTSDVRAAARQLGAVVEQVCEETGYERLHVVGHSLGGIVARYYVQRLGGDERVHTLCTLGSPHGGTRAARLLPPRIVRQLRPDAALVRELAEPATGCRTRMLAFWSDLDQMVIPKTAGRIDHPDLSARNVGVRGLGHLTLPRSGSVVHTVCTTLSHLDEQGETVTAGVTSLAERPPRRRGGERHDRNGGVERSAAEEPAAQGRRARAGADDRGHTSERRLPSTP